MTTEKSQPVRYAAERLILRLVFVLIAIGLCLLAVPQLWRLFSPFIIALAVAASLQPAIRFCQEKLHIKRGIAVAFWVLLVCVAAFVLLYWFVSFVVVQVIGVANNAPSIMGSVTSVLQAATDKLLGAAQSLPGTINQSIQGSLDSAFKTLSDAGVNLAGGLVNLTLSFAASLPYAFVYANFLTLGLFFLAGRYPAIQAYLSKGSGKVSGESISVLRQSAIKGMLGYIRVQLLFSMLTLLLSWVYFQAFGFDYAILIGVVAALLELIPQFGCGTLYIPWSIISFIIGSSHNGWVVLGLYLGYSLLRRLTEPMLLGSNLGVSPLLSLIGMFVGMQLGGIIGLILGPIVMVVLVSAIRAQLFDGILYDISTLFTYMTARWKRGHEEIYNAEK